MAGSGRPTFKKRFQDSKQIAGQSLRLLASHRDLWVLPIAAVLAFVAVFAGLAAFIVFGSASVAATTGPSRWTGFGLLMVGAFFIGVLGLAVASTFQAAYAFALHERMEGRRTGAGRAVVRAFAHYGTITRFSLIASMVGLLLGVLGSLPFVRVIPFVGRLVQVAGGLLWAAAAFFVIPVIVVERQRGTIEAVRRSVAIGSRHWGKTAAGVVTISLVLFAPFLVIIGLGLLTSVVGVYTMALGFDSVLPQVGLVIMLVALGGALLVTPLTQALQTAYRTALYHFAMTGRVAEPYTKESVDSVWEPYRR